MQTVKLLMIGIALAAAHAAAAADEDIAVSVAKRGPMIVIDVEMPVQASGRDVWAVLTDYEHMAAFVSNLTSSAVLSRKGNRLEVEQIGEARRGPLAYPFETVRAIELVPFTEIRSTLIRGAFTSYAFTTRIVDNGASATVLNHGEYEPTTWVPPLVGPAMIESETRNQYAQIRNEIMRRKAVATATQ